MYKNLWLLFYFFAGIATPIYSQSKLDSIQHLGEVVLIAKSYKEIIPVQRLQGKQLESLNSHSVADALRYFSGIQIKDYGGIGGLKTVDVRNMGSHHVGVFYDGIPIGNVQNGTVDLGKFSLDDLEELSLYNGQKSEIFQSAKDYASASAVYMKTKNPDFKKGKYTNFLFRYKFGSIQLENPSFRLEQKLSDCLSMSLSLEYIQSNGNYKFRYRRLNIDGTVAYDTTTIRKNSDIKALRLESGLYGKIHNGSWQAKVYFYNSDRGLPGAIVKNVFYNGERQGDKNFFAQGHYIKEVSPHHRFQLNGKFAYDYIHYLSRDSVEFMEESVTKKMQYDNYYYQQEYYLSAVNMVSITPWWDASLSTDTQYNKLNATMKGVGTPFSFPRRFTGLVSLATAINLGELKAQASLLGTFVTEDVKNNTVSPDKWELSPAVFIGYKPFRRTPLNLRIFYKRIFRMPTFNDLYYAQIGYSNLKPEYTDQINIGFTYEKFFSNSVLDRFSIQADTYYADITDKIIAAPTGSSFRWMMTNMGHVVSKGIDASTSMEAHIDILKLGMILSYSYSKAQDFTRILGTQMSSYGDQIPYTPWQSGSAIANIGYKLWTLNYSFIYVGERYDGAVNNIVRNHVEPWYTHDISVQKTVKLDIYSFKVSVEANNIFNQYYDVVLNYPMPGRNFRFVLTLNI